VLGLTVPWVAIEALLLIGLFALGVAVRMPYLYAAPEFHSDEAFEMERALRAYLGSPRSRIPARST
jgi:hypothetical protein